METPSVLELDAALRAFGAAWAVGDTETLGSLLSPSYTHNDASGAHLNRDEWLAYAARRQGRSTRITFHDVKTRLFGDVPVVTGFNVMTGGGVSSGQTGVT